MATAKQMRSRRKAQRAMGCLAAVVFAVLVALSAAPYDRSDQLPVAQRGPHTALNVMVRAQNDAAIAMEGAQSGQGLLFDRNRRDVLAGASGAAGAQDADDGLASVSTVPASEDAYVPGELIVGLSGEGTRAAIENLGFAVSDLADGIALVAVEADRGSGEPLAQVAQEIAAVPGVEYVQPNYRYASAGAKAVDVVRDEDAGLQYYLNSWNDAHGANVAAAWELANPANTVDVAVLDTGVYVMGASSGDAAANSPNDGTRSDAGFHQEFDTRNLDIADGLDFVHKVDGNPQPLVNAQNATGDDNGHGTHVAAIIAARTSTVANGNDPVGMAGVSPVARIVPIKVLDAAGEGSTADFISAYAYLLDKGRFPNLHVVNMSLSLTVDDSGDAGSGNEAEDDEDTGVSDIEYENGDDTNPAAQIDVEFVADSFDDTALRAMIRQAEQQGVATVCAAGNEASAEPTYPSDYPECISVTALDETGANAAFSNLNQYKDISAPGVGIYSAWNSQADAYATLDGTSQATAIVSGVLSMMWAANPAVTVAAAKDAIYATAHAVEGGSASVGTQAVAAASGGSGGATALVAAGLEGVDNGSHGAIDAAAAIERAGAWSPASLAGASIEFEEGWFAYTGAALRPEAYVSLGDTYLVEGEDYTVAYANNVNPGIATVTVQGIGSYAGSASGSFEIQLAPVSIKKLKKAKKAFTVSWARQKSGSVGYQVRYSLKKSMKKATTKTVKKNATTKLKVKKLKAKKRYYVQVRTYKKIGGKTYYSTWSAKKSVKTK